MKMTFSLIAAFFFTSTVFAVSEQNLQAIMKSEVMPFIAQHGHYEPLSGAKGLTLSTFTLSGSGSKGDVILITGQGEFIPKYYEIAYDLIHRGYSAVHILEHRGQGGSPRILPATPRKGSVDKFSDYVEDLTSFVETVREERPGQKLFLLAHSMGGAVSALMLDGKIGSEKVFSAVVLSAPMLGIKVPVARDTRYLLPLLNALCLTPQKCNDYAPAQAQFNLYLDFNKNLLTHSKPRWKMHQAMLQQSPSLGIDGPTNRWVLQATRAAIHISKIAPPQDLPMLVLQAGEDQIVVPKPQEKYCAKSKNCQLIKVSGSKHEILQQNDEIRSAAVDKIDAFFSRH